MLDIVVIFFLCRVIFLLVSKNKFILIEISIVVMYLWYLYFLLDIILFISIIGIILDVLVIICVGKLINFSVLY